MAAVEAPILAPIDAAKVQHSPTHFPQLDVVRFIAFGMVFLHHGVKLTPDSPAWIVGPIHAGGFGVCVFFVLSSYLITRILIAEHTATGRIDIVAFWIRRSLRIWPLYFAFILIAATALPNKLGSPFLVYFATFTGNWACVFHGYPPSPAAPLWSVSIEEQFYLVWPILLLGVGMRHMRTLALALICVAIGTRLYLSLTAAISTAFWCNTFAQLDSIAIGAMLALAWRPRPLHPVLQLSGTVAALVIISAAGTFEMWSGPASIPGYLIVSLAAVLLIVSVGGISGTNFGVRAVSYLGRISYGLYVFHRVALSTSDRIPAGNATRVVAAFALTVATAALSYHFLERPFLKLKDRFARQ